MIIRQLLKLIRSTSITGRHMPDTRRHVGNPETSTGDWRATALILTLTLTSAAALTNAPSLLAQQQPFDLYTRDGLVTLRANNAPVIQLADALAQELNISVVISGDEAGSLSADIVDEPVEKALAMLSPNHMLVRENSSPGARIVEVVLMLDDAGASNTSVGEFLPSGDPTDAIAADEGLMNIDPESDVSIGGSVEQGIEDMRDTMLELEAQQRQNDQLNGAVRMDPPPSGFDPAYEQDDLIDEELNDQ